VISVLMDDTSQSGFTTAAETEPFTCPEGKPDDPTFNLFLPIVLR
jgi:hypothetical protein